MKPNGVVEADAGFSLTGNPSNTIQNGIVKAFGNDRVVILANSQNAGTITETGAQFGRYAPPGDFALRANLELGDISEGLITTVRADNVDAGNPVSHSEVRGCEVRGLGEKAGLTIDDFRYFKAADAFSSKGATNTFGFYSDICLLYTSPSPRDRQKSRMPSSA